jgi:two-component system, LytTR family, response regulator
MIQAIAIDDEPLALEVLKAHAKKVDFINLNQTFVSAAEALLYLKENEVDLVFLDINMPDITGLDFSQLLPPTTAFIFTTAYSQYAVDAFKINALDYLLKPIDFHRFMQACQKAHQNIKKEAASNDFIFVKDGYDLIKISIEDLMYIESDGNYLTFKEKTKKTTTRMKLADAMNLLPTKYFFRVHKSYLLNLNFVQKIEKHQIAVSDHEFVPIAANYREDLMEALKGLWRVS